MKEKVGRVEKKTDLAEMIRPVFSDALLLMMNVDPEKYRELEEHLGTPLRPYDITKAVVDYRDGQTPENGQVLHLEAGRQVVKWLGSLLQK